VCVPPFPNRPRPQARASQFANSHRFRVIPSYSELFRVQKADRGTSRPAACPNAKGARLYNPGHSSAVLRLSETNYQPLGASRSC